MLLIILSYSNLYSKIRECHFKWTWWKLCKSVISIDALQHNIRVIYGWHSHVYLKYERGVKPEHNSPSNFLKLNWIKNRRTSDRFKWMKSCSTLTHQCRVDLQLNRFHLYLYLLQKVGFVFAPSFSSYLLFWFFSTAFHCGSKRNVCVCVCEGVCVCVWGCVCVCATPNSWQTTI
jgi:hypothetical protein